MYQKIFLDFVPVRIIVPCYVIVQCIYLLPSKLTAIHIATKTNETNTKNNFLKKARCRCNGKVIIINLPISKNFIFYFTYIV